MGRALMTIKKQLLKFCAPSEHALENIAAGQIFCQHHAAYNDPFEFWSKIVVGIPDATLEPERFLAALRAWGFYFDTVEDALADETVAESVGEYFEECVQYVPPFTTMRQEMRIACFASEPNNLLMWSHYADGLRGFCVVFDEELLVDGRREAYALDVSYTDKPPEIDSFIYGIAWDQDWFSHVAIEEAQARIQALGETRLLADVEMYETSGAEALGKMQDLWQRVFASKPVEWRYEGERRLLIQTDREDEAPLLWKYDRKAVREVILGERMSEAYKQRLMKVLEDQYPGVPVTTARRAQGSYSVVAA